MEGTGVLIVFLPPFVVPPLAYAETHYRFRYFGSLLYKREPELLADAPHRVDPGQPIPILLLAKDADRYPVKLLAARARVTSDGGAGRDVSLLTQPMTLSDRMWWTIVMIGTEGMTGWVSVDVRFTLDVGGRKREYANDNFRTSTHAPLRVYLSPDPLPKLPGLLLGEGHSHSDYTDDQVEFGTPLPAIRTLSRSMGIDFATITDHSYDLDDSPGSYLVNDPALPKWTAFQEECDRVNAQGNGPTIIRGEEVTCRNSRGGNVHCLVLGDRTFHPGSGDSAERWFQTHSELALPELTKRISPGAIAIAAHCAESVPAIQRLLLGRDTWHQEDLSTEGLGGLQFWNGSRNDGFNRGRADWIRCLLASQRPVLHAGNDAHGNFSRYRQIAVPFVSISDIDHQLFGRVRTGLFADDSSESSLMTSIRQGRSICTDGPAAMLTSPDGTLLLGSESDGRAPVVVHALSSAEFGPLAEITLFKGVIGEPTETIVYHSMPSETTMFRQTIEVEDSRDFYVRCEVSTSAGRRDGRSHLCLTNAAWFRGSSSL